MIVRRTLNSQINNTENIMSYIQEQHPYLAPEVEVIEAIVEQGFEGSGGQLPDYEEDDDVIIIG